MKCHTEEGSRKEMQATSKRMKCRLKKTLFFFFSDAHLRREVTTLHKKSLKERCEHAYAVDLQAAAVQR